MYQRLGKPRDPPRRDRVAGRRSVTGRCSRETGSGSRRAQAPAHSTLLPPPPPPPPQAVSNRTAKERVPVCLQARIISFLLCHRGGRRLHHRELAGHSTTRRGSFHRIRTCLPSPPSAPARSRPARWRRRCCAPVTTAGAAGVFVRLSSRTRSAPAGAGTRVADISAGFRTCTSKMKTGAVADPIVNASSVPAANGGGARRTLGSVWDVRTRFSASSSWDRVVMASLRRSCGTWRWPSVGRSGSSSSARGGRSRGRFFARRWKRQQHRLGREVALHAPERPPGEEREQRQPEPGQHHPLVGRRDLEPFVERIRPGPARNRLLPENLALEEQVAVLPRPPAVRGIDLIVSCP